MQPAFRSMPCVPSSTIVKSAMAYRRKVSLDFTPYRDSRDNKSSIFENELKGFVEHKRMNAASPTATNVMFNVGHVLSPEMIEALATSFHDLNPKPFGGAPKQDLAVGKKIFEEGVPSANVPACATCHGADAKGNGPIPRLAGQLYPYVAKQLTNWSHERAEENSNIMAPIAHGLTESQIDAVAAYVSYLE